jgi:hypothetical protein
MSSKSLKNLQKNRNIQMNMFVNFGSFLGHNFYIKIISPFEVILVSFGNI